MSETLTGPISETDASFLSECHSVVHAVEKIDIETAKEQHSKKGEISVHKELLVPS